MIPIFRHPARITLACAFLTAALCASAQAGETWRLVQATGAVSAGGQGLVPVAVRPNEVLPDNGWIQTGSNGRAVLSHGNDTIIVGPLSRVQLPSDPKAGNTQVLQSLGSALYQIGKETAPHFQVDTPYLAAVVKGTTFVVSVEDGAARVDVTEGLVEVASEDGTSVEYVHPGHAGIVASSGDQAGHVVVVESHDNNAVVPEASQRLMKEASEHDRNAAPPAFAAGEGVIAVAIGEVDLNIREVSAGLASGPVEVAAQSGQAKGLTGGVVAAAKDDNGSTKVALVTEGSSAASNPGQGGSASPVLPAPALDPGSPASGGNGNAPAIGGGGGGSAPATPSVPAGLAPDLGNAPTSGLPVVPGNSGNGNSGGNGGGNGVPPGAGNGNGSGGGAGNSPVIPPKGGGG